MPPPVRCPTEKQTLRNAAETKKTLPPASFLFFSRYYYVLDFGRRGFNLAEYEMSISSSYEPRSRHSSSSAQKCYGCTPLALFSTTRREWKHECRTGNANFISTSRKHDAVATANRRDSRDRYRCYYVEGAVGQRVKTKRVEIESFLSANNTSRYIYDISDTS